MNDNILKKLGISELNDMQTATADALLHSHKDIVVLSPTGTGKTLSYLLPLVERLNIHTDELQALVVVPGRELALQSCEVLKTMGSGLRTMSLYGGRPTMDEHREMRKIKPQIVFGTPGRLNDHIDKGNILTDGVTWLIIDEFDKCLEMGFHHEMSKLIDQLGNLKRRILLSATEAEEIPHFVNLGRTTKVDFRTYEQVSDRVTIYEVKSLAKDKLDTLRALLLQLGEESSIIFLNYRDSVERTATYLRQYGFSVSMFHGGLEQKQREEALYRFSNGSANIMVCTDLASRGLDIPDIQNIIHYHLPESEDGYIHRVGRTARWDKEGRAFFILNATEQIPAYVNADIESYTLDAALYEADNHTVPQPRMATLYIGKGKRDKLSKADIVGFLCKKGGLKGDEIGKISVEERYTYVAVARKKARQVLKQVQGEKIKGIKTIVEEVR